MNSPGKKVIDDLDAPERAPVRGALLDGAYVLCGHPVLQQVLSLGYQSEWAEAYLPWRRERKAVQSEAGCRVPPGKRGAAKLMGCGPAVPPADTLARPGGPVGGDDGR